MSVEIIEYAKEGASHGWKRVPRRSPGRVAGRGVNTTRGIPYPPRNASKPACRGCGRAMTHLYFNLRMRTDYYGCLECSPPWEGE